MVTRSRSLRLAALFVFASAALHLLAPLPAGFEAGSLPLVAVGLVYAVIGYFLIPNRRWLAWLAFLVMLAGCVASIGGVMSPGGVPDWWWMAILAVDLGAAIMLFVYLWFPKPAPV